MFRECGRRPEKRSRAAPLSVSEVDVAKITGKPVCFARSITISIAHKLFLIFIIDLPGNRDDVFLTVTIAASVKFIIKFHIISNLISLWFFVKF